MTGEEDKSSEESSPALEAEDWQAARSFVLHSITFCVLVRDFRALLADRC